MITKLSTNPYKRVDRVMCDLRSGYHNETQVRLSVLYRSISHRSAQQRGVHLNAVLVLSAIT
jgi:hypothetical protein